MYSDQIQNGSNCFINELFVTFFDSIKITQKSQPMEALNMILYLVKVQRKVLHSIQYFRLSFFQIENQNEWTIAKSTFLLRWVTLAWEHRPTTKYIIREETRLEWQKGARSYVVAVMGFNLRHRLMDYVLLLHCIHTVVNTNAIEGEDC